MIERAGSAADTQQLGRSEALAQPRLRPRDRRLPVPRLARDPGRDARGERAAGAVGVRGVDPIPRELRHRAVGCDERVRGAVARQVAALHEHPHPEGRGEPRALGDRLWPVHRDRLADELGEFEEVRGDEVCERHEGPQCRDCLGIEQRIVARRDHDGIEHDRKHRLRRRALGRRATAPHLAEPGRDRRDDVVVREHPDLQCVDAHIVGDGVELRAEEGRARHVHLAYPAACSARRAR